MGLTFYFHRGALDPREAAFAKEVMVFEGKSFTGISPRNAPGIDGFLTNEGGFLQSVTAISLKETGGGLGAVLRRASKGESQAANAGFKKVDLYIKAENVDTASLVDFATKGQAMGQGGLTQITTQGTINSITVFTSDGVVRIQSGRVFSCTSGGNCR